MKTIKSHAFCRDCGARLPDGPLAGLCPVCLLDSSVNALAPFGTSSGPLELPVGGTTPWQFGRYRMLEEIARGGAGVVFRARDESLHRDVALKFLRAGLLASRDDTRRLFLEARAAARLQHPGIVPVFEVGGADDEQPFLAMALLPGGTLAQRLKLAAVSPSDGARWLAAVARAVQHAHRHGILHRDLKPGNILFDAEGRPQVADFGLARLLDEDHTLTRTDAVLGTPAYLAPEQASGRVGELTTAADIHALGAILYELLAGRPPFEGENLPALLRQIAESPPIPPSQIQPGIPRDLEIICLKCLEKEPAKRYATAQALAEDLDRFLNDEPIQARPVTRTERAWRWCRRKPALAVSSILAFVLLLVLGLGGPIAAYRVNQARQEAQSQAARATAKELEARRSEYAADMLLAQKFIAENNRGRAVELLDKYRPSNPHSRRREEAQTSSTLNSQLPSSASRRPRVPSAATDLRGWEWHYLATVTRSDELAVLRGHKTQVNAVSFSPDGRWLASGGLDASVRIWDAKTYAFTRELSVGRGRVHALAVSSNGKLLAAGEDPHKAITFWDTATWQRSLVLTNEYRVNALAFSPKGQLLAAAGHGGGNGVVVWDLAARSPVASWPLPDDLVSIPLALAFSPDGRLLVYDLGFGRLGRWDTQTRQPLAPIEAHDHQANIARVAFAEDGTLAVTSTGGGNEGVTRAWSLPDWKPVYQLTNEFLLTLSAREDLLLTSGNQEVHCRRLRTGESRGRTIGHLESLTAGAISPTAPVLATASYDKTVRLWPLQPPAPGHLVTQLPTNEPPVFWWQRPEVTRDGRHVLTVRTNGTLQVWNGVTLEQIADLPWPVSELQSCDLSTDGRFVAAGGKNGELAILEVATSQVVARAQLNPHQLQLLRFSPDGTRLAAFFNSKGREHDPLVVLETRRLSVLQTLGDGVTVMCAEFTPDHRFLVTGDYTGVARVFDLERRQDVATFRGHQGWVIRVATTPDARLVATCGDDGTVRTWDARTGQELGRFRGTWELYDCVALSPDGSRLAAGAAGVDVWDLVTGRQVQTLPTPNEWVQSLAWTPDMGQLTTAARTALRVWPADSYGVREEATDVLAGERDEFPRALPRDAHR